MAEKKKILIISPFYLRSNSIASVRPRKIAKFLNKTKKYDISVLTAVNQNEENEKDAYITDLTVMERDSFVNKFSAIMYPNSLAITKGIWNVLFPLNLHKESGEVTKHDLTERVNYPRNKPALFLEYALNYMDDIKYYRRARRVICKQELWKTEIVFSTYGPFSSHLIARYIKKKNPKAFWIADFRDPVYTEAFSIPTLFRVFAKGFVKKKCKTANRITAVTQGILDCTDLPDVSSHVILNGFDPGDAPQEIVDKQNERFTLSYTGTLYNNRRDLTPIFKALRELIDAGLADENKLRVSYAGAAKDDFTRQIDVYNLQNIMYLHGFVSREKALEIQRGSDILLAAQLESNGIQGSYSGKLFEYMMMKKPVIFTMAGKHPDKVIRELFNHCSLGVYYEEANSESDYQILKDYILRQYNHFMQHGSVLFEPNTEEIEKYNYANIVSELETLFR